MLTNGAGDPDDALRQWAAHADEAEDDEQREHERLRAAVEARVWRALGREDIAAGEVWP